MKISKERTKKAIRRFLEDMEWMFDVQNFDKGLVFKKEDWEDKAAVVNIDSSYRRITIEIYPCFFEASPEIQREYLLHEFSHCFTTELLKIGDLFLNGKLVTQRELQNRNEEAVCRITSVLDSLLRGKLTYAKKGYARYLSSLTPKKKVGKTKTRQKKKSI